MEAIDTGMSYQFGTPWSISGKGSGVDSPAQPLTLNVPFTHTWYRSKASDTFQTFAMYRPPPAVGSQPTTYIPIARYTWAWHGEATRTQIPNTNQFNPWQLVSSGGGASGAAREFFDHQSWNGISPGTFGFGPANN